jgi:hypothetical protein
MSHLRHNFAPGRSTSNGKTVKGTNYQEILRGYGHGLTFTE